MRKYDAPPIWLIGFVLLAWVIGRADPFALTFGGGWRWLAATFLIAAGVVLTIVAVREMQRRDTTFLPNREADHLVTTGIFAQTRNPIYLGDTLILAGLILSFDAPLSLALIPAFVWVIQQRFIAKEEQGLRRKFPTEFQRYAARTRRWL